MADNSNIKPVFIKQPFPLEKEAKTRMADMCQKGETLFDKITPRQARTCKLQIFYFNLIINSLLI